MIYQNISELCKENGIAISRLEKEIGLGNATIRGWETSSPTIDKLKLVADYFNVSINDLLIQHQKELKDEIQRNYR